MATLQVNFIFCCPCFAPDIFETRFHSIKKNFEFAHFVHRRHPKKPFDIKNFQRENPCLFVALII